VASRNELEQLIRRLHLDLAEGYEDRLERQRVVRDERAARARSNEEETRDILSAAGVDLGRVDALREEDGEALDELLRRERPRLADRPPVANAAERALRRDLLMRGPRSQVVSVYGATLLGRDAAFVEGNPGEHGNPWVLPWNPGRVKIKAYDSGYGWGCWAQPRRPDQDASTTFWFPFVPDQTGWWHLLAIIWLHGYRILHANGAFLSCDNSSAKLDIVVDVYQYYWNGRKHFTQFDIDQGDIHDIERIDIGGLFDYRVALGAGDWAVVMVQVDLYATASGRGSYSMINFADGTANYIEPEIVSAGPDN
jgi:hypothetical protein